MEAINEGEVWFVEFPLEEDKDQFINRPVIVLDTDKYSVLSVKLTKHTPRTSDKYDVPILYWSQAKLRFASTARISKVMSLPSDNFQFKIGDLHPDDLNTVTEMYISFMEKHK